MPRTHANRIKELREAQGLSMERLAAQVRPATTAPTIDKLEKGRMNLTQDWIYRIAEALGIHPLEILEPLPKLTDQEAKVVEIFRGLGEADQDAFYRVLGAMTQAGDSKDSRK